MEATLGKTLDAIGEDAFLSNFLSDAYSQIENTEYNPINSDQMFKLNNTIDALTQDIYHIVTKDYAELVNQSNELENSQRRMSSIQERVNNLVTSLERLRSKFNDPYNKISRRMLLLLRLKDTSDLLRKAIRILQLTKKLHQNDADVLSLNKREITKCKQMISEIESLLQNEPKLHNIDFINSDVVYVTDMKERIEGNIESGQK